jgi:hypothetical protein
VNRQARQSVEEDVNMGMHSETDLTDETWGADEPIDWPGMMRLALIVSLFAAAAAMALVDHMSETAIVLSVIVLATMASWFHLEHAGRVAGHRPRPARVRRSAR